ncbi:hypothetical protein ACFL2A_03525 [Thermodesulfobacteriota bacterium]
MAAKWNIIKKRRAKLFLNIALLVICIAVLYVEPLYAFQIIVAEDASAKDVITPKIVKEISLVQETVDDVCSTHKKPIDKDGLKLFEALLSVKKSSPNKPIDLNTAILDRFTGENMELLIRHLATSTKWYVSKEDGKLSAYRRFVTECGCWEKGEAGVYYRHDFDYNAKGASFGFKIVIGIEGRVFKELWHDSATLTSVDAKKIKLTPELVHSTEYASQLILQSKGPTLEVYEESISKARPFTSLAISSVVDELETLLNSMDARESGFDPSLMPLESMKSGDPEVRIVKDGGRRGLYHLYGYINPGESGSVYLKAFDATKNTPLPTNSSEESSIEYIGWSNNEGEQFFYNTSAVIYEGDSGVHYPARFELWFVPDSGKPERKLIEKTSKIKGRKRKTSKP